MVIAIVPLGILASLALSWGALPVALEGTVFYNDRPAHPLQLGLLWVFAGAFIWTLLPAPPFLLLGSLTMMLGGATSNLLYRLFVGPVPDYIPLPFGAWGNIADMLIFLGAPLFLFSLLRHFLLARRLSAEA